MAPFEVTTVAGSGERGHLDGLGVAVKFSFPGGVTCDSVGNLVVVDNNSIRKVHANGAVTTLAGSPGLSDYQDGVLWLATAASNINWGFLRRKTQPGRLWIYFTQLQLYAMPNPLKRRRESTGTET